MSTEVLVAIISGIVMFITSLLTLLGVIITTRRDSNKTKALIIYRMDELEKKVNLHNNLIERTYILERDMSVLEEKVSVVNHRITDLEHK